MKEHIEGYTAVTRARGDCEDCAFTQDHYLCNSVLCSGIDRVDSNDVKFFKNSKELPKTSEETKLQQIIDNLENNWYKSQQEILEMVKEVINE